jgi:tRNA guanosine-2'-O-methyltransferase
MLPVLHAYTAHASSPDGGVLPVAAAERWIRLLEVGRADLRQFLRERKAEGYAVVAVEQAKGSVVLSEYDFPRRCVLLLGNEQNGVDVGLLREVDVCVEIPMLGVTRSLNAHVSGAMAVWQYTQQWWEGV